MRRRLGIAALVTIVACLLGALAGWYLWLPAEIETRISEAASRRGLTLTIGALEPGFGQTELRSLTLRGQDALIVDIESLVVEADLLDLASEGRRAIRSVTVDGVRVGVDAERGELGAVFRALRGEAGPRAAPVDDSRLPAIDVTDASLILRDSGGELATVDDLRAELISSSVLRMETGGIVLGSSEAEGAGLASAVARLEHDSDGWRLTSLILRDASLRYDERAADDSSPTWDRVRAAVRVFAALVPENGVPEDGVPEDGVPEDGVPEDGVPEDGVPEDGVPEDDEGAGTSTETDGGEGAPEEPSRVAVAARIAHAIAPRLSTGATLRLEGLSVIANSDDGSRHVLRELEAEARALDGGRYHFEGVGRPGRGGRLAWDLTIDPNALRAEGSVDFQRLPFVLLVPFLPDLPWYQPEDTHLTGDLTIRGDSASRVHLEGEASVEGLALSSSRIAPVPVRRIAASFDGEADWLPLSRRLEIPSSTIGLGQARAQLSGSVEWPEDHYQIDVRATLPPTECNTAVGAIPADLLAEANAFTFRGRLGGQIVAHVDSRDLGATRLDIDVADGCIFLTAPGFADVSRFTRSFVHRVVEPDGTEFIMETGPETLNWTPISQISPFLVQAVLGHEDGGFFRHSGFSEPSIRLALVRNLRAERYVYGASTITMQLVKNVFLHREKTLARKVQEVLLTWWVESVMEKQAILELYLNVIEYGPEIYGIRAAAMHYFGRSPALLGPAESAYLATILPNPKAFHSHWEDNALPAAHRRRVTRFLRGLGNRDRYDSEAVAFGLAQLEDFRFYRPGESVRLPAAERGHAGPLPIDTALAPEAWDEDSEVEGQVEEAFFDDDAEEGGAW